MQEKRLYVGGYSDGLYRISWTSGERKAPVQFATPVNPSYGVINQDETRLYLVSERAAEGGAVVECEVDAQGDISVLGTWETSGGAPCHICLSPSGQWLAVANYAGGSVDLFLVREDGSLSARQCIRHEGKGIDPVRQEAPHTHFVRFVEEDLLCVIDLGLDVVRLYRIADDGADVNLESEARLEAGSGPRHMALDEEKGIFYVCCELQPYLYTLGREGTTLRIIHRMTLQAPGSTKPANPSGIRLSRRFGRLYIALRGSDAIASVSLSMQGIPQTARYVSCEGKMPREIEIDPSNCLLLCANQESDCLCAFGLDANGDVDSIRQKIAVPTPTWMGFIGGNHHEH